MKKSLLVISLFCLITSLDMQNAFGMKRLWDAISSRFTQPQIPVSTTSSVSTTENLQDHQFAALQAASQAPEKKKTKAEEPGAPAVQSFSLFPLISLPERKHLETKEQLLERQKALNLSLAKIKTELDRLGSIKQAGVQQKQLIARKQLLLKQQSVQRNLLKHVTELIEALNVMTQPQFQIEESELAEDLQEQRETEQLLERAYAQIEETRVLANASAEIRKMDFQASQEKKTVATAADELQPVEAEDPEIIEQLSALQQQLDAATRQDDAQDKTDKK